MNNNFLLKRFIKNYKNVKNSKVREQYGKLSSIVGIIVNIFLFATKFVVGTLSHSVSITGDAINNLSDAGSSVISLVSFKMSSKPADNKHPFGHARIEYVASSIVAVVILLIGVELLRTSFDKILHPIAIKFSIYTVFILAFSIIAKLWLYRLNANLGKHIDSSMLHATAADSLSDVLATAAVLTSTIISPLINFQLDGFMGIAVGIFIMLSGINILKGTMDSILGQGPSNESIDLIDTYIRKYDGVMGIHDLVVHDYGPNRCFASVHVEVDANVNILDSHDLIDNIERDISVDLGIHLVIHLDPIVMDNPIVNELHLLTEQLISSVDESLSMHDFRVVKGTTHSNLIFDVMVPYQCKKSDKQILEEIIGRMKEKDKSLYVVITIDRSYVSSPNHKMIE